MKGISDNEEGEREGGIEEGEGGREGGRERERERDRLNSIFGAPKELLDLLLSVSSATIKGSFILDLQEPNQQYLNSASTSQTLVYIILTLYFLPLVYAITIAHFTSFCTRRLFLVHHVIDTHVSFWHFLLYMILLMLRYIKKERE